MSLIQKIGLGVIGIIIAIGAAFFFSQKVLVDNSSAHQLIFSIDDTEYTIEANTQLKVSLVPGEHVVTVKGLEIGKFQKQYFDYGSILNPTKSSYILESIAYGTPPGGWMEGAYKDVVIDGESYYGPFEVITDLYFAKKFSLNFLQKDGYEWDFGLGSPEPDEVSLPKGKSYVIKVKISGKEEFDKMYVNDYL